MAELPHEIHQEITSLCESGNQRAERGEYSLALEDFCSAWNLLPDPKYDWEAGTWILAALGDCQFLSGNYNEAYNQFRLAMVHECPGARENPFIRLRRGQCLFEIGDQAKAGEELAAAYMLEGAAVFASEDAKYFEFLQTVLREPGW